jgi:alkylated DNA repair dioxygenase AlkB
MALEDLVARALARLDPPPLPAPPPLNDLVVQRYAVGSRGITPHRDHLRYRDLVALVNLAGRARFFICADRSGRDAREIPLPPGSVLLMRAPDFAGRSDRPFHMLSEVTETRISLGLRHDVQREEAAAPA